MTFHSHQCTSSPCCDFWNFLLLVICRYQRLGIMSLPLSLCSSYTTFPFRFLILLSYPLHSHLIQKIGFPLCLSNLCLLLNSLFNSSITFLISVAPSSKASFDPLRHMRRGDVTVVKDSVIINLSWTKTLQRYRQSARVRLFAIPGSPLCPVAAYLALQRSYPVLPSDPLLSYRVSYNSTSPQSGFKALCSSYVYKYVY
jgi:hypothetical protein